MSTETRTHLIEGVRCPACSHGRQFVTFAPAFGYGVDGGTSEIVGRSCGAGCGWTEGEVSQ